MHMLKKEHTYLYGARAGTHVFHSTINAIRMNHHTILNQF